MVLYGTRVFTKFEGYFGERKECEVCHRTYRSAFVRNKVWAHLNYIPLFPVRKTYFKMCPICGNGIELKAKEAKAEMASGSINDQNIQIYAKHFNANKPKELLAVDTNYEVWLRDANTGEDIGLANNITKDFIKNLRKERGIKTIPIREIQ